MPFAPSDCVSNVKKVKEDAPRRSGADEYEITGSYNDDPACNQGAFFNRGVRASLAGIVLSNGKNASNARS